MGKIIKHPNAAPKPVKNRKLPVRSKGNVKLLPVITTIDTPVPRILAGAKDAKLNDVVVLGWDADNEFFFSSSKSDAAEVIYLLRCAEYKLMDIVHK